MTRMVNNSVKTKTITSAAVVSLMVALGVHEGTAKYIPYKDPVGVWTVCKGITGPDVHLGKTYTAAECDELESTFVKKMTDRMGQCLKVSLSEREWRAWGHWSWNVGPTAFCKSQALKYLNEGQRLKACDAMLNFHFAGGKSCYLKSSNCPGLITRRKWERSQCILGI